MKRSEPFADLLLAWATAIVAGRNDLSVIVNTDKFYSQTKCDVASNGVETRGEWPCIFAPIPHLCAFDDEQVGPCLYRCFAKVQCLGKYGSSSL